MQRPSWVTAGNTCVPAIVVLASGSISARRAGATVFQQLDVVPGFISIPIGAFADPAFPQPCISVYEQQRHGWFDLPDGIEHHG